MAEVIGWLGSNWQVIVVVLMSIVSGASIMVHAVAPFTKSKKDDEVANWLDKAYKWLNTLALNPKPKA